MLLGQWPQGRNVIRIPGQQLDEIENVTPLAAAEAAEALDLILDRKDAEAGGVLLVKWTQRERATAGLLVQGDSHVPEHPTDRHGLPELLSDLCKIRVCHHVSHL